MSAGILLVAVGFRPWKDISYLFSLMTIMLSVLVDEINAYQSHKVECDCGLDRRGSLAILAGLVLRFVVVGAAAVVLTQAATMRRHVWMSLFLVVACLFNPVLPVPFSNYIFGLVSTSTALLFFFSLELLQPRPRLSIASITDRMPGSESL